MELWIGLTVLVATVGVTVDAAHLGARRGALGGGFLDMGPVAWFFSCLLLWWAAIPCYLVIRPRLVRRARGIAAFAQGPASYGAWPATSQAAPPPQAVPVGFGSTAQAAAPPVLAAPMASDGAAASPGYYPNPDPAAAHGTRWWDGQKWADDH